MFLQVIMTPFRRRPQRRTIENILVYIPMSPIGNGTRLLALQGFPCRGMVRASSRPGL
jgi:hypothetical protein